MRARRRQLLVGERHQRACAALVRELDSLAQQLPGFAAAVAATQSCAEVDERTRVLEPSGRVGQHIDGLPQEPFSGSAALDQAEGAQRDADRARGAPPLRELELLVCQLTRLLRSAEAVEGECGFRPPRRERGILDAQRACKVSGGTEVCQRLLRRTGVERDKPADAKEVEKVPLLCHGGSALDQPLRLGQLTALEEEFGQVSPPVRLESGGVLERHSLDRPQILFCAPQIADLRAQQPP